MRGRDFLDIHTVAEYFSVGFNDSGFHRTVTKVFQAKHVALSLIARIAEEAVREYHRPDFISLAPTIKPGFELQDYDFYYNYLVGKCKLLEPLWRLETPISATKSPWAHGAPSSSIKSPWARRDANDC